MKKSIRQILESHKARYPRLRRLIEDEMAAPYAEEDADVPAEDEGDGDGEVEAALLSLFQSILDGDGTLKEKLTKIDRLCAKYGMNGSTATPEGKFGPDDTPGDWRNQPVNTDGDGGPGPGGARTLENPNKVPTAGKVTRESFDEMLRGSPLHKQLTESVTSLTDENTRLKSEAACRALLEEHNRTCDAVRLKALTKLSTSEERVALIETWEPPKQATVAASRPERSYSAFHESGVSPAAIPKDSESLARALR